MAASLASGPVTAQRADRALVSRGLEKKGANKTRARDQETRTTNRYNKTNDVNSLVHELEFGIDICFGSTGKSFAVPVRRAVIKFEQIPVFYPRGCAAPAQGISPIAKLERFVVYYLLTQTRTTGKLDSTAGGCRRSPVRILPYRRLRLQDGAALVVWPGMLFPNNRGYQSNKRPARARVSLSYIGPPGRGLQEVTGLGASVPVMDAIPSLPEISGRERAFEQITPGLFFLRG